MKPDEHLMRLAAVRHGAFSLDQARAVGMSSDMLTNRVARAMVVRDEPGVYRFAAAPQTWKQRVYIATLAEHGYASIRTAGALWPLDGCRPGIIEVTTERWRRRPNPSIRVHETRLLHEDDLAEIDGIPVLSRERAVVDLAMVLPAHRVEMAMDTCGVDLDRMWECVERLDSPGRPWVAIPRRLLASRLGRDGVPPNLFENRLFRLLARAALPTPEPQVEIRRTDGSVIRRVDWLLPSCSVVLECDSYLWHGAWRRRKRDIRTDRELTALGYRVVRITWDDLEDEPSLLADLKGAIRVASA